MIITDPDILHQKSEPVAEGEDISHIVDRLTSELKAVNALAISAIQVGIPKRVFAMKVTYDKSIIVVNPVIVETDTLRTLLQESCLSCPGKKYHIWRPNWVNVKWRGQDTVRLVDLLARVFLHEFDHLEGRLIEDVFIEQQSTKKNDAHHRRK